MQKAKKISSKRLKEIQSIRDEDIDYSDIPELDDNFWKNARVMKPIAKQALSLRLDQDIVKWFKKQGKGYQSYMNNVLRAFVESQKVEVGKVL